MAERVVEAIKGKVELDASDLTKAEAKAKQAGEGIKQGMTTASTHTLRAKESFTTLMQHMDKLPPIVGQSARSIESLASSGASGFGLLGMAGAAAAGAIIAGAEESIHKYLDLAESVHSYMQVTGESAAASSAQVQAFRELGVGEDVAAASMLKLSKAIEGTPKKLEALGIEVAKDAKGNVDLNATLFNVIDAWNATEDAALRNQIVLTAFGKAGAQMIPILQEGSANLRKLEADVRVTMTEADIERVHRYSLQQKQQNDVWNSTWEIIGQKLLPIQQSFTESVVRTDYVNRRMDEAEQKGILTANSSRGARLALSAAYGKEWDAAQTATLKLAGLTDATKAATAAAAAEAQALDDAYNAEIATTNAGAALERANLHMAESQTKVEQAQKALNKTIADYGPDSDEARAAAQALSGALSEQKQSYLDGAAAAQKLAEDQAGPDASATDKAAAGHAAYILQLKSEANTLAPGSALRAYLDAYIARLEHIPPAVNTVVTTNFKTTGDSSGSRGNLMASGGPVVPGQIYHVGEEGDEWFQSSVPGRIIPHGQRPDFGSSSTGASDVLGAGSDMSETNALLRALIDAVTAEPSGQTGVEAALYRAMQGAALSRARGMAGA